MSVDERWIDKKPTKRSRPTQRDGVVDALLRAKRAAGNQDAARLPMNRAEARRFLKAQGPHMRFRYEVDDDGVRRVVRVRM